MNATADRLAEIVARAQERKARRHKIRAELAQARGVGLARRHAARLRRVRERAS
jgi:hypothetical protein